MFTLRVASLRGAWLHAYDAEETFEGNASPLARRTVRHTIRLSLMTDHDVVVVGAGPVGLALALGLARGGAGVLVLEKKSDVARHSRAPAIWPRTQEILAGLSVLDVFVAEGTTLSEIQLWDADRDKRLLSLDLDELRDETAQPCLLILPQSRTEALLRDAVEATDRARVLFSAEVVSVRPTRDRVEVEYRMEGRLHSAEASYLAGCDGAHSTTRNELSIDLQGRTYGFRAALADIRTTQGEGLHFPRLTNRNRLTIGIRMATGLWRLILPFGSENHRDLEQRIEDAAIALFPGVRSSADYDTVWRSEFDLHTRIAGTFGEGRVALAGDAAHLNSPVGGQGMNAGIQDAEVLTRHMLDALASADPSRLETYRHERRRQVEEGVNPFTDRLTRFLLLGEGRLVRPALFLGRTLLRFGPLRRRFLRRVTMLEPSELA